MKLLYNCGIRLMDAGIRCAAPFNDKARLWKEGRRGLFEKLESLESQRVAWFHAASLGEFEQGRPVIEAFRERCPEYKILVTFFSPSGYEIRKNYSGADCICYLPVDTPKNVRRFMQLVRPEIAVFIKYEFWYNYLTAMQKAGTRLYLISAIFRQDQIFFKPHGGLFRQALSAFTHLFVQDDSSKRLLHEIGIDRVSIAGDTRFDRVYTIASSAKNLPEIERFAQNAPVFIAGSTWPPDEELLLTLIDRYQAVKFIIAPHEIHPSRIEKLRAAIRRPSLRYTELTPESDLEHAEVLFIDTIGLLSSVYRYGTWGYIGGGFGAGIHNTLEAATFGLPLAFGPRYEAFKEAKELIAAGGAHSISNADELIQWFDSLFQSPDTTQRSGNICKQYVLNHKGATQQIIDEICR
ncbi:MAG TPA: 3-deoxy-D-manno-octulosonic acid transferase [Candidatus Alistipes merdigallinarum]|nr:3-deoxy-D-manno-octulosonic acid transferase [Candidatus Alistipes merdigallinarum]